jgi:DNA adenine methylase
VKGKELKRNIEKIKDKLKSIKIEKADYKNTIQKYDSPNTFFYLDPPYFETLSEDYETGNIDHKELADILKNIKGKFLLSHNDIPYYRKLYKGFKIKRIKNRQFLGGGIVYELLIKNY